MLQRCNPSLPTHDWKVAKMEEMPGPTIQAAMILNKESLAPIDADGGELNFGFSSVFIRVYNSDSTPTNGLSDKPAEEDITKEIECPELPELDGYVSDASTITRDLSALCTMADQEVILDVASIMVKQPLRLFCSVWLGKEQSWTVGKVSGLPTPKYKLFVADSQALETRTTQQ
ncbi:hypothetical protein ACLKA6_020045 [Drosophila palustris]